MNAFRRLLSAFGRDRRRPETIGNPKISEATAERIAAQWATEHGRCWTVPTKALFKTENNRTVRVVESNAHGKGHRVIVAIDASSGEVIADHELPR